MADNYRTAKRGKTVKGIDEDGNPYTFAHGDEIPDGHHAVRTLPAEIWFDRVHETRKESRQAAQQEARAEKREAKRAEGEANADARAAHAAAIPEPAKASGDKKSIFKRS